jgi:hypothetical protein
VERKNKSKMELARERQRLAQVKLLSPMSGLVAVRQNRPNFMFPGYADSRISVKAIRCSPALR